MIAETTYKRDLCTNGENAKYYKYAVNLVTFSYKVKSKYTF